MLSSIGFLIKQILGIVGSQIEIKNIFSFTKIDWMMQRWVAKLLIIW
jgi:hypothetical protein